MSEETPISRAEVYEAVEVVLQLLTCCIRIPENQLEARRRQLRALVLKEADTAQHARTLY
jgi:hypothetical protein